MLRKFKETIFFAFQKFLSLMGFRIALRKGKYRIEKNIFFDEFLVYKKIFDKDQVLIIFDVGAHVGQSIQQFHKHFSRSEIHAFEPGADNFSELYKNYQVYEWAHLNNLAVGQEEEISEMYLTGSFSTGNSLVKPKDSSAIYDKHTVQITTIDDYCRKQNISSIDILKIDIQGYEPECLAGAEKMLHTGRIAIIKLEIMMHETYEKRTSFSEIEQYLLNNEYMFFDIPWLKKSSIEGRTLVMDVIYIHKRLLNDL